MGRKKIAIARIADERNRQITFSKRKAGLLKKAYELSILCDCEIAVIMISSNRKLYQYASSNMNSILIRYTEFKDPDESKTNADILDDIQRKERGAQHGDESGGEDDDHSHTMSAPFLLTPHTQAQFGKMNEEFDNMLHRNQILLPEQLTRAAAGSGGGGGGEMGGARGHGPPRVMPVSVPVAQSPGSTTAQLQQHLVQQLDVRGGPSSGSGSSSSGTLSSVVSPQSDMAVSPASAKSLKSPTVMPPPVGTPTRLQTLRNQSLKLHLPGSGRNYISLGSAGSTSPGGKKGARESEGEGAGPSGSKPHLRVKIPGQKGFVPRTQATSPLPQMELTRDTMSGAKDLATVSTSTIADQPQGKDGSSVTHSTVAPTTTTTHTESLTTPILSLATPNLLSALPPPLFSSLTGEFPFSALMSSGTGGGGGGTGSELSSALVAFPVSIQPTSTSGGGSSAGNIVLQAQNMGQPFLLTPNVDPRQNPMLSQTTFTPPPSSTSSLSPNVRDLEQLKHQYERVHQQLLQQQLFISQQLHHQQQHQQQMLSGKEIGRVPAVSAKKSVVTPPTNKDGHAQHKEAGGDSGGSAVRGESSGGGSVVRGESSGGGSVVRDGRSRFQQHQVVVTEPTSPWPRESQEEMDTGESVATPPKRPRVDTSPEQPTSV